MPEAHRPHDVAEVIPGEELLLLRVKEVKAHLGINIVKTCKILRSRFQFPKAMRIDHLSLKKNIKYLQAFDLINGKACRLTDFVKVDALVGVGLGSHGEHSGGNAEAH